MKIARDENDKAAKVDVNSQNGILPKLRQWAYLNCAPAFYRGGQ